MAKFKSGKKLWIGVVIIVLVALLTAFNFSSFRAAPSPDADEYVSSGVYSAYVAGPLSLDIGALARYIALFILMSAALLIEFRLPKKAETAVAWAFFAAGPFLTFEVVKLIIGVELYATDIYFTNLLFYAVFQVAVFVFTQSTRLSVCISMVVWSLLNLADEVLVLIRGTPLVPTDLYAIGTALKVTNASDWHFNANMLSGLCACIFLTALISQFKVVWTKKWLRPTAAVCAAAMCTFGCVSIYGIDYESYSTSTFDTESTNNVNGTALSFYINLRKMSFDEPVGYSKQALEDYLGGYTDETLSGSEEDLPNIIVIMNESFSDLGYLGRLRTDTPYMPFYNDLSSKYPDGRLLVSVLGGGTCNTEFEFLTGLSMMYMPDGCYAYMQHIKGPVDSMASYLKNFGYQTVAMHPFYEICWKRNAVYPFMGFDDFVSGEDMTDEAGKYVSAERWEKGFGDDVEYIRTLISDSYFYKQVINQFENKTSDRIFIFGVTVQNHSTYEYDGDDFETDVHIQRPEGEYPRAEQYLSLIKDSDEALEELISYFEGVDEKTMIVFFGDHQPNVEAELIDELAPDRELFVNSFLTRYQTPFTIWSNYDLGLGSYVGITSANYLGLKTLEAAGIPLSAKYQMIRDAEKIAPAMAAWGYYDPYTIWNDRQDTYKDEVLNMYNFYTYWALNDQ